MRKDLPPKEAFIGKLLPNSDYVIQRHLGSGLRAHVFVAHSDSLARDVACKIIPAANLVGGDQTPPAWRAEITKANSVPSSRVVKIFSFDSWAPDGHECVYLLADLVNGKTLKAYLKDEDIDLGFVETLLLEMFDFLRELQEANLHHGDLHAGNILVEDRRNALSGNPFAIRVTDFGVAPATSWALLDDYDELAKTLGDALKRIDYQTLSAEDRIVYDVLRNDFLSKRLVEKDKAFDVRARDPRALAESLRNARKTALAQVVATTTRKMTSPFDYLSCEQLGEYHALLKDLYSDKMLGLEAIEDVNNLVLTGPRGCGKTTVYRSLSLKHRVLTDDDAPDSIKYVAVYYRCDDLSFLFPRYQLPTRQPAWDVPIHFLTATLLVELLSSVSSWLAKHFSGDWMRLEARCAEELWRVTGLEPPHTPAANTFAAVGRKLEKERDRAAKRQRFVEDPTYTFDDYFAPDVVVKACEVLKNTFPALSTRPIYFLVDDYSSPKISSQLQQNLNRLLMQRSAACFFKLATESPASYESNDVDGKSYVEGREFKLVNLGMDFINADGDDKLRFVDDIFNKRFAFTADFPVKTLDLLLGNAPTNSNEIARQLRDNKKWEVWGRHCLGELCSGDVHFLIELVGKMVASHGGLGALQAESEGAVIPPRTQNKAIRDEAGNFLRGLRALPRGPELVAVVEAFGNVAGSYLRHKDSKNEGANPPHQASRIEPYEDPKLSPEAKELYNELLRYSVFIEDVRGKSRRGHVVPRLYLRRFLIPVFNLTFSKRDSLELSNEELTELLMKPADFESRKRMKARDTNGGNGSAPQLPLELPKGES